MRQFFCTHVYRKKKLARLDDFFCTCIYLIKKKLHNFTVKEKKLHNLTKNKNNMHVANLPTLGPLLILSPALKRWGPPRWQGLCSHHAHLWATSDLSPALKDWGPPKRQVCSHTDRATAQPSMATPPQRRTPVPRSSSMESGERCRMATPKMHLASWSVSSSSSMSWPSSW